MNDVIIVGGGLVGAACALGMSKMGLDVVLLEAYPPQPDESWDARVYAVSPGNVTWLKELGAWAHLGEDRRQVIRRMEVHGDAGGALQFDAYEAHTDSLAWIVENRQLQTAIWTELRQTSALILQTRPQALQIDFDAATCVLENGQTLSARLLVAADGAGSWTRQQMGIKVHSKPYAQMGVVANFELTKPHFGTAKQWFKQNGILAWLPLPGQRMSMVWAQSEADAQTLLNLNEHDFCQQVQQAGFAEWGDLKLITAPQAFPLRLNRAEQTTANRLVLVGDAAHTVHPLAGQGVNLGFRDARELLSQIRLRKHHEDIGASAFLRHYARSRVAEVMMMQRTCDALQQLFNRAPSWLAPLRNWGLSAVNQSNTLKRQLISQAML